MSEPGLVDYVVIDLDGGEMLGECIRSIAAQELRPSRIVVVDNGSLVPVKLRLPAHDLPVEVIRFERNHGFAAAANAAIVTTTAPFVALVNNDVVLDRRWSRLCVASLTAEPTAAAVQSVITMPDGRVDGAGIVIEHGRIAQLGHQQPLSVAGAFPEPWGVSATAAIFRRAALIDVAFDARVFDELFFAYYEDVDLAARLRAGGWICMLVREPLAVHRGSATAPRLSWLADHLRVRNRYLFARKNRGTASIEALVLEDLRRIGGRLVRFDLPGVFRFSRAVVEGLFTDIRRRESMGG